MTLLNSKNPKSNIHNKVERILIPFDLICDIDIGIIRYLKSDKFDSEKISNVNEDDFYKSKLSNPVKFIIDTLSDDNADILYNDLLVNPQDEYNIIKLSPLMELSDLIIYYINNDIDMVIDIFVSSKVQENFITNNYISSKVNIIYLKDIELKNYDNIFIKFHDELSNFDILDFYSKSITFLKIEYNNNINKKILDLYNKHLITTRYLNYKKKEV